jgi:RNA polymerase sigma-70 factor (ECF subfamily)
VPFEPEENIEFIKSLHKGEEQAFDRLFREYFASLTYFAFQLIHNEKEAEDIVQDCFVALWNRRSSIDHIESIKSYLYTSIRYRCINYLKKTRSVSGPDKISDELVDESADMESLIITAETANEIYRLIELLPPRMQQVVRLYFMEGKSYQEIGALLNTDPETVRNQRFKALQFIRKTIIPG